VADENEPVGDVTGRVIVVTGASSGIGLAAAHEFARRGARVALVGRDTGRLDAAVSSVRAVTSEDAQVPEIRRFFADFAVLDSVRELAASLADAYPTIDVLCNNAGGVNPARSSTVDGHELTMQANHLGPFLLTNLLRERLTGGRVVNTASDAHRLGAMDPDALDSPGRYRPMVVYGTSKQANILFAAEAARRWPDILSYSYHPGVVRTRFGRDSRLFTFFYRMAPFLRTPEQGADTMVWLAGVDPSTVENGGYYVDRKLTRPSSKIADPSLPARLWAASERAVGLS
jgi:NAD(P)-dependent dehydrogenase (short-subunit alcohol dehydrogenase family)